MKLRVLDLFSGIGGFSLGLERAKCETGPYDGFETVAFCEIEAFPRKVLAKHWPNVPCYSDIRELSASTLVQDGIAVDVICGGFPCQDISSAGNGAGLDGSRSGLWFEYARLIGELRPRYVIVENVAELLGNGMGDVLGSLAALGYDAEWEDIPASAVGAYHDRRRIWILAYAEPHRRRLLQQRCFDKRYPQFERSADACASNLAVWNGPEICPPDAIRMADGLRSVLDEAAFAALGNAVVPQIPELIGNAILEAL